MSYRLLTAIATAAFASLAGSSSLHAIMLGQVDTFQDGTMSGWVSYASPSIVATGGPGGDGDRYLRLTSTGGAGADGALRAYNSLQWAGNYTGAGVTAVEVDLRNEGPSVLEIRAWVFSQTYGGFISTTPFSLPADSAWHHAVFGLGASDLTWIRGNQGDLNGTLSHDLSFALLHQVDPLQWWQDYGTPIASQMGIDNVRAVPEPATLALIALGVTMVGHRYVPSLRSELLRIGRVS